jgi:hypothetical protein
MSCGLIGFDNLGAMLNDCPASGRASSKSEHQSSRMVSAGALGLTRTIKVIRWLTRFLVGCQRNLSGAVHLLIGEIEAQLG